MSGAQSPRVSVCIPTFNRAEYVRESIRSVLAQRFGDFELVVIDDASDDHTPEVVASFGDPRVRYHRNERNLGVTRNFNRCLELARGEFIMVFGDDDVMLPDNLGRKVEVMDAAPGVGLVHSNIYRIDARGEVFSGHWADDIHADTIEAGEAVFRRLLLDNFICFPSGLFRRRCIEELGGFDPELAFTLDWQLWLRIALHFDVAYLAEPLMKYRLHEGGVTAAWSQTLKRIQEELAAKRSVLDRYADRLPDVEQLRALVAWKSGKNALRLARRLCRRRLYDEARECIAHTRAVYPQWLTRPRGFYVRAKVGVGERGWKGLLRVRAAVRPWTGRG